MFETAIPWEELWFAFKIQRVFDSTILFSKGYIILLSHRIQ